MFCASASDVAAFSVESVADRAALHRVASAAARVSYGGTDGRIPVEVIDTVPFAALVAACHLCPEGVVFVAVDYVGGYQSSVFAAVKAAARQRGVRLRDVQEGERYVDMLNRTLQESGLAVVVLLRAHADDHRWSFLSDFKLGSPSRVGVVASL